MFIGGGVAAILTSATKYIFPFFPHHSSYAKILRSIREERIFMAGGMAAGLAVAFDAPIAGVLFALEGATAFLSAPVVLRIFGCAMFASFFNDLGHTYFSKYIKNHNLLEVSNSGTVSSYAWQLPELLPFIIIGLVGGVMGAMVRTNATRSRHTHTGGGGHTSASACVSWCLTHLFCASLALSSGDEDEHGREPLAAPLHAGQHVEGWFVAHTINLLCRSRA